MLFIYRRAKNDKKIVFDGYETRFNKNTRTKILYRHVIKNCRNTVFISTDFRFDIDTNVGCIHNRNQNYVKITLKCPKDNNCGF